MGYIGTDSRDLGICPAAVDMETGDIYINTDVWKDYTPSEQQFILAHEKGHFEKQTDSEIESDEYALCRNFGKVDRSLKSAFTSLEKAGVRDSGRVDRLYRKALEIDAENGNMAAAKELEKINYFTNKNIMKQGNKMGTPVFTQIEYQDQENWKRKNGSPRQYLCGRRRADGETTTTTTTKSHKKNGVCVGGYYLSFTNIMLVVIAVLILLKR